MNKVPELPNKQRRKDLLYHLSEKLRYFSKSVLSDSALLPICAFRLLLDFAFIFFVSPVFTYMGYILNVNLIKVIESYILFSIVYILLPKSTSKPSNVVIQIFIIMSYFPMQSYYALTNQGREWFYLVSLFWLMVLILNRTKYKFVIPKIKRNLFSYLILFTGFISIICIGLIYIYYRFSFNIDFYTVYETRSIYSQVYIPFGGYIVNWVAKVTLPFLVLVSIFNNKNTISYTPLTLSFLLAIILSSSTGSKSYFFVIFLAIGLGWLLHKRHFLSALGLLFSAITFGGVALYLLLGEIMTGSILIRRLFFTPAKVSYYYHMFFNDQPLFLSHSLFKSFISYPYKLSPPNLIGSVFYNNAETNANTGIVADGFMNFGIYGIFMWAFIIVILLKLVDAVAIRKSKSIIYSLIIISFYNMVNGFLFTSILTHGLLLALLISYLYPTNNEKLEKK